MYAQVKLNRSLTALDLRNNPIEDEGLWMIGGLLLQEDCQCQLRSIKCYAFDIDSTSEVRSRCAFHPSPPPLAFPRAFPHLPPLAFRRAFPHLPAPSLAFSRLLSGLLAARLGARAGGVPAARGRAQVRRANHTH